MFGINRVELFLAQQRDVDGIHVGVEHGFGQTRVRAARRGVLGDFMHFQARAQGDQFQRRRGFFRRQEQIHFARPRSQTAPAGEHAQRNGKRHSREHGREPPEQRLIQLPHEHAPDQSHQRVPPMPPDGGRPRRAVRRAFLRTPAHVDAEQIGDDELRVPEHQDRRVQRGEKGFAGNTQRGARQTAEGPPAFPVEREVNKRERLRQHDDDHANHEDEQGVRRAAPIGEIGIERRQRDVRQAGVFLVPVNPVERD